MPEKTTSRAYRVIRALVRFFYPKFTLEGAEHLPKEPCILVGNHAQTNGPVAAQLYLPRARAIWCAGEMMDEDAVADYAYRDFWSQKPRWTRPFYRLLAHLIKPLALCLFRNADTIPVYRDRRILLTFRRTVEALAAGADVVIFPEHDQKHGHVVYDFQDHFVDVARLCRKRLGYVPAFVPMYVAPRLGKLCFGAPVRFDPDAPLAQERRRVCDELMDAVTGLACALPAHTVIPYRNIRRRDYPRNTDLPEVSDP